MTHRRSRPGERGFSLLETLVAGSLLVVALTGVTLMSLASAQNNARASAGVEAIRVAQDQLHQVKSLGLVRLLELLAAAPTETTMDGVVRRRIFPTDAQLTAGFVLHDGAGRPLEVRIYAEDIATQVGGAALRLRSVARWQETSSVGSSAGVKQREQVYETVVSTNL